MLPLVTPAYTTDYGTAYCGDALDLLAQMPDGSVNLVFTSPPFALQSPKAYGNRSQEEYVDWFVPFAREVRRILKDDGSFVVELGGSYRKGVPVRSLYNFRVLIRLCDEVGFFFAEDFYWHNTAKLPTPTVWVSVRKIRAKDSVSTVWWMSKTEWPKADVGKAMAPYSIAMKSYIASGFERCRTHPSGHKIGPSFNKDNGGSLPSNLLQIPNSVSSGVYLDTCRLSGEAPHPARFPGKLPEFFIRMLTDPGDTVLDIFAGSNTTGSVAEAEDRRWLAFELSRDYVATSAFRFLGDNRSVDDARQLASRIRSGQTVNMNDYRQQQPLL
jgi:site-specific DNA-methyltransferase (cytosine-N4-specific)